MAVRSSVTLTVYSETRKVKQNLDLSHHDRWGFIAYRCTYGDDPAWEEFNTRITARVRADLLESDAPEILENLSCSFLDDKDSFDKASVATLRQHFKAWISNDWQLEQPRGTYPRTHRYQFFVRVDREAFESVLDRAGSRDIAPWADAGWVHLVNANWGSEVDLADPEDKFDQPDISHEPIEGCREEDVGWMKVPTESIGMEMYSKLVSGSMWYTLYERPPRIAFSA